ncbi:MAG: hypothetical protein HOL58_01880 [Francisellaceae bacterium]|nr:hypothetical protein [Francisellaceae bacterium]
MIEFRSSVIQQKEINKIERYLNNLVKKNPQMADLIAKAELSNPGLYVELIDSPLPPCAQFVTQKDHAPRLEINLGLGGREMNEIFDSFLFELCNAAHSDDVKRSSFESSSFQSGDDFAAAHERYEHKTKFMFNEVLGAGLKSCGWPKEMGRSTYQIPLEFDAKADYLHMRDLNFGGCSHYERYKIKWSGNRLNILEATLDYQQELYNLGKSFNRVTEQQEALVAIKEIQQERAQINIFLQQSKKEADAFMCYQEPLEYAEVYLEGSMKIATEYLGKQNIFNQELESMSGDLRDLRQESQEAAKEYMSTGKIDQEKIDKFSNVRDEFLDKNNEIRDYIAQSQSCCFQVSSSCKAPFLYAYSMISRNNNVTTEKEYEVGNPLSANNGLKI